MIQGRILFISLIATGCIAAILGILQMWFGMMETIMFGKVMITLGVIGVLASFLLAVDYDFPGSKTKMMMGALVLLAFAATILILGQVWLSWLAMSVFWKIAVTLLILTGLVAFILAAVEDFGTNKKLKDDNFID